MHCCVHPLAEAALLQLIPSFMTRPCTNFRQQQPRPDARQLHDKPEAAWLPSGFQRKLQANRPPRLHCSSSPLLSKSLTSISSRTALSAERMAADATSSAELAELSAAWARSSNASHCRTTRDQQVLKADRSACQKQERKGPDHTCRTAQCKQAQGEQTSSEHAAQILLVCSVIACRWP